MAESDCWPDWSFRPDNLTLQLLDDAGELQYEVDLERCTTAAQVLDWIIQVSNKAWAGDRVIAGLVRALDQFLDPQSTLCSMGMNQPPIDVRATIARMEKLRAQPLPRFIKIGGIEMADT